MSKQQSMRDPQTGELSPSVGEVADERDHVIEQLTAQLSQLNARLERLESSPQTTAPPTIHADLSGDRRFVGESEYDARRRRLQEELSRRLNAIDDRFRANEEALKSGPKQFTISMAKEPMMTRVVGAEDQARAQIKYLEYFGCYKDHGVLTIQELTAA